MTDLATVTVTHRLALLILSMLIIGLNSLGFQLLRILWEKSERWIFGIILFSLIPAYSTLDIFVRYIFGGSAFDFFR